MGIARGKQWGRINVRKEKIKRKFLEITQEKFKFRKKFEMGYFA